MKHRTTRRGLVARRLVALAAVVVAAGAGSGQVAATPDTTEPATPDSTDPATADTAAPAPAGSAGPAPADCEASEGRISIATGNSTGVYFVFGGGVADLISDNTPIRATAAETGASVQNIEQLVNGDYQIAFSLADSASDAVEGLASFDEPQPILALGRIHTNYTHVIVRNDAEIDSIEDMEGKAISTGSPRSGTEVIATRLLESAGLSIDDVNAQRLELGQTVDGIKDGTIDGFFWSGGLPTAAVTDLLSSNAGDVTFLDVTPQLEAMQEVNTVYTEGVIPADAYGLDADVATIIVPNVLLVRDDFAENDACAITRLIWSSVDELTTIHPAAAELDPSRALETGPIPLHPGAVAALESLGAEHPDS